MKAFLIDPQARTITEVEQNGLKDLYALIECDTVDTAHIDHGDVIFVDDNGLSVEPQPAAYVYIGYHWRLVGKGVVVGTDAEGDSIPPRHTLDELHARIQFLGVQDVEPDIEVRSWGRLFGF